MPSEIDLYGSRVRYWIFNADASRTILAVHGFRGNHVGLEKIISGLQGYRVIVPDLPGYGESTPMTELRHDVEGYCRFVESFMGALDLDRPVLLGHSFGTIVTARLAATKPELISELILVNPIAVRPDAGLNWPVSKLVDAYYWSCIHLPARAGERLVSSRTFNRLMSLTLTKTRDKATRRSIYRHHLEDLEYPQNLGVIAQSYSDSITKTASDDAGLISARTLLVAGELDTLAPAKYQRRLQAQIPGSSLVLIPRVGHLVHLETPLEAARAIAGFLG